MEKINNNKQVSPELREFGKWSEQELRTLLSHYSSGGWVLLKRLFDERFEQLKEAAFRTHIIYGDYKDAVLHGNRLGQKDMMDYIINLQEKIKTELKIRNLPIDI